MVDGLSSGPSLAGALAALAVLVWPAGPPVADRLALTEGLSRSGRSNRSNRSDRSDRSTESRPGWVRALRAPWASSDQRASIEQELLTVLEGVAGALRAGLTPTRALAVVGGATTGEQGPVQRLVVRLAALSATGEPLERAWRRAAGEMGSPAMAVVAEAWALTERHGAPVVDVLDAMTGALRDQRRAAAAVETALAAPRATAALLGVLPVGGLGLGELVGVHPLALLVTTGSGRIAGLAGLLCTVGGRLWMRRLVAKAATT